MATGRLEARSHATYTCKQIYEEGTPIFYSITTFQFDAYGDGIDCSNKLPENFRAAINNIHYNVASGACNAVGLVGESGSVQENFLRLFESDMADRGKALRPGVLKASVVLKSRKEVWTNDPEGVLEVDR